MKNYNDDDFRLVPMNMNCNPEYAFMPLKNKNQYKNMNYNLHNNMMNKYNSYPNHNCCCMHAHHSMLHSQPCPYNYHHNYNDRLPYPTNMDDTIVKTLITVKKKSELFD